MGHRGERGMRNGRENGWSQEGGVGVGVGGRNGRRLEGVDGKGKM